jgi:hypothetical protein
MYQAKREGPSSIRLVDTTDLTGKGTATRPADGRSSLAAGGIRV